MNEQSNNPFSSRDIERYHTGAMTAGEMHALERAALDDPFLADALEGYATAQADQAAALIELHNRLDNRIAGRDDRKVIPISRSRSWWLRVAAMFILIAGAGILAYQFQQKSVKDQVATIEKNEADTNTKPAVTTPAPTEQQAMDQQLLPVNDTSRTKKNLLSTNDSAITIQKSSQQLTSKDALKEEALTTEKSPPSAAPAPRVADKERETTAFYNKSNADSISYPFSSTKPVQLPTNTQAKAKIARTEQNQDRLTEVIATTKDQSKLKTADADQLKGRSNGVSVIPNAPANTNIFRGQVVDANNAPLPFANVTVTDNHIGTYTDNKGYFVLVSPDSILQVQVKSVGFENNLSQLKNNQSANTVVLTPDTKNVAATVLSNRQVNNVRKRADNITLEEPEPSDGWDNYDTYLANNISIPEEVKFKPPPNNEVELSFTVDKNGDPVNIKVEKSVCGECDAEAIRLVRQGPRWKKKKNSKAKIAVTF